MVDPHPAALSLPRLEADCHLRFERRSGPGGQHRNKVATAVIVTHRTTGVMAEASERRSQAANRATAYFRLRVNLAIAVRCPRSADAVPSDLWRRRFSGGMLRINGAHEDFPAVLAEALDVLDGAGGELPAAAAALGCSPSQLWKLLQKDPRAAERLRRWRKERGLRPLH